MVASDDINDFPDEILAMIMEEYVYEPELQRLVKARDIIQYFSKYDEDDIDDRPLAYATVSISLMKSRDSRVLLGISCKRWREIALNTPRLWAQIHLGWPKAAVSMYFERSASSPLSLAINKPAVRSGQFGQITSSLETTNTLHRLTRLLIHWPLEMSFVTGDYGPISPELLSWTRSILDNKISTPNLSQFHLWVREDSFKDPTIENLAHLPFLTDVRSQVISLKSTLPDPCRLTTIQAECSELRSLEIVDFLASCPLLEEVTLKHKEVDRVALVHNARNDLITPADSDDEGNANIVKPPELPEEIIEYDGSSSPIHLRYLREFDLKWCTTKFMENIVCRVTFPEGSYISLCIAREDGSTVLASLPPTLRQALPQSVALEIKSYPSDESLFAFNLAFKGLHSPCYSVHVNEFESTYDWHNSREPSEKQTLRINETEDLFQELSMNSFPFLESFMINARCLKDMQHDPINSLFLQFRHVETLRSHTGDADRLLDALGSKGEVFRCPALKTLDIRNCSFDPEKVEQVLQDRKEWAVHPQTVKVTLDPRLTAWTKGDRSAAEMLQDLEGCETVDGAWTDSPASGNGNEDVDVSEDDENGNGSGENWPPEEGVDDL
ncbi:hypothetical protein SISNIDRAFT_465228 [Sistotremastrum niveocremeum HHB9708]|uniref:F-box domain-containing protein n=1 Tax=Sistotremastrum niveocremeum HHB9708 TaxID=1314777 RepID=A0A164WEZ3_9AGAM|nr:hypothetical protein SISNIDRAFT_465228 [Sistotremastrum niveocremeum HHB9708]